MAKLMTTGNSLTPLLSSLTTGRFIPRVGRCDAVTRTKPEAGAEITCTLIIKNANSLKTASSNRNSHNIVQNHNSHKIVSGHRNGITTTGDLQNYVSCVHNLCSNSVFLILQYFVFINKKYCPLPLPSPPRSAGDSSLPSRRG